MENLSDDILSIIFRFLGCRSDRDSFGLTCHRWLNIQNLNRRSLQFECSLSVYPIGSLARRSLEMKASHLHRLLSRFQNLNHLSLSGCTDLPDSALIPLQFYGSQLCSLYLDCCFRLTDTGLSLAATSCPLLSTISLYRCNITDIGLQTLAESCPSLKQINLSFCPLVTDIGLEKISRGCSQLLAVQIAACTEIHGIGFNGCSPTLAYVDAESCNIDPKGISGIFSGGGLKYLNIQNIGLSFLGIGLRDIGSGLAARLKILNMRLCRTIGDESVIAIAKGCPVLEEWNLALCHGVRVSGWESIGVNCKRLERLHVNRCRNLCERGLEGLARGCERLSVLYMSRGSRLSEAAVLRFKLSRGGVEIKEEEAMCITPDWRDEMVLY